MTGQSASTTVKDRTSDSFNAALGAGRGTAAGSPAAHRAAAAPAIPESIEVLSRPEQLAALRDRLGLRKDWHEPDNQEVSARILGTHLDNAMGPGFLRGKTEAELADPMYEFCVVIEHDGQPVAAVNLATLLSWGSDAGAAVAASASTQQKCSSCGQLGPSMLNYGNGPVCRSCATQFIAASAKTTKRVTVKCRHCGMTHTKTDPRLAKHSICDPCAAKRYMSVNAAVQALGSPGQTTP